MSREASSGESRFARLERLFHRLRDVDATARAALLALEGEVDAQLRAELDAMLDAHDRDAPIVEESVLVEAVRELATHAPFACGGDGRHASPLPESIGEYRIVRVLGEGGMGVVYEAEQRQPRRRVALKVVRGDLLLGPSRQERLRRFAREVEALGRLEHPAIARVYAAGEAAVATELGRSSLAYVAMELVEGRPFTEGTATRLGNARQRMELLAKVCDGVAAAHVAGIVHRDLKPANILVTSAGEPKILDFGIARIDREAERGAGRTRSLHTEAGQLLGTVPYMSPEQFGGDSDHVDARSDVYALGVIAFELLTDRLPIDVRSLALADAARAIRDDPPKRLGDVEPACRGDLETIVAKALEKDPDRRYANAAAFGDDIRRWLRHEPIVARPATAIYQMRTFARRHRTLVGATLAVIAVLVAASITLSVFWIRERDQRAKAEAANRELERQAYRATLAAARSAVKASEFTAAARHLALASEPLRGWEWRYLARQHAPALATVAALPGAIVAIQISDDGRRLFAVDDAGHGAVVDRASFHVVWRVDVPVAPSAQILVDPRGERFIVRAGGTVRGFATSDRQLFQWPFDRTFSPHPFDVAAPEFLATDLGGGDLLRFDARTGEAIGSPRRDRTFAHAWTNSRGQLIAWEKQRESTGIVDEPGGWRRPGRVIGASTTRDQALLFTPDRLEAIDTRDGALLASLRGPFGVDDGFALDRTGRRIAVSKAGDVTHVELLGEPFDAFVGRYGADSRRSADLWGRIACFAPDDDLLFTGAADGAIRAWVPRHQPLWRLPGRNVNRAAFSPDGQTLATARWGTVRLFDTATGRQQWSKVVHRNEIFHIAWSPDGRSLLTGDERGNIRVLDAADGVVRVDWACAAGRFDAVGWMHDGRILALAGVARAASKPSTAGKRFVCDPVAPDESTDDSETDLVGPIERDSLAGRTAVGTREGGIRWLDEPGGRDGPSPPPLHPPAGHRQPLDWILIDRARQQVLAGAGRSLLRWPLPAGPSTEGTNAPIVATAVRGDLLRTEAATLSPDGSRLFIADRGGGVRVLDAEQLESIVSLEVEGLDAIDIAWRDDESLLVSGGEVLLAALETGPSAHASERAARSESIGVVGALFDAHRTVERVRGAIESHLLERAHELGLSAGDPVLTALRDELLRSAEEHGDDPNLLNSEAWKLLRSTEGALGAPSAEDRRRAELALEYVAISSEAFPQDHAILNTQALAFVRCGRPTEALAALDRCDALARASRGTVDPFDLVVRAMAHVVAGDRHAARLQREEVQRLAPEPSDGDLRAFLAELDAALASPSPSAGSAAGAVPTGSRSGASTGGEGARTPPSGPLRTQAPPASSQSPDPSQQRAN